MRLGVYVSLSFRVLVNIEALNAVESLGNIIRHRKATIVVPREGGFQLLTVPVVSGEALRHGYQLKLAELAAAKGVRVCNYCRVGEFIKHGVTALIEQPLLSKLKSNQLSLAEKELAVIEECVVEDVGGFLIPIDPIPVRRTSCLQISYLMPAIDDLKFGVDVQFHVRNAPGAQAQLTEEREVAQAPYYVESASAVYTFSANLDLSGIGVTSNYCPISHEAREAHNEGNLGVTSNCQSKSMQYLSLKEDERLIRAELALAALAEFVKTCSFGGKHSSYQPFWIPLSMVAVLSSPLRISAMPGHKHEYAKETYDIALSNKALLKKVGIEEKCTIFIFSDKKLENKDTIATVEELTKTEDIEIKVSEFYNISQLFDNLISKAKEMLEEEMKRRV